MRHPRERRGGALTASMDMIEEMAKQLLPRKKKNSRNKGAVGERELAAFLRERGHTARRGQQFSGGTDSPDVVCETLPGVHLECKRVEAGSPYVWLAQAIRDAGLKMPVVAHRRNRQDWIAVLRLEDLLKLLPGGTDEITAI